MDERRDEEIVVGVDGSDLSVEALRWAAHQAAATGARLHVVTAWAFPERPTPFGVVPELPLTRDPIDDVRARLYALIEEIVPQPRQIELTAEVVRGVPDSVLLEAAKDAQLLVVGSHGRGVFSDLLLGSVSERCVRHAKCPVVVVHHQDELHGRVPPASSRSRSPLSPGR